MVFCLFSKYSPYLLERHCEIFTTEILGWLEFASNYYEGGGMHKDIDKPRLSTNW